MTVAETFPDSITAPAGLSKTLQLAGHGEQKREVEGVPVRVSRFGAYYEPEVVSHLQAWKGKSAEELRSDEAFISALAKAPVEKFISVRFLLAQTHGFNIAERAEAIRERLTKHITNHNTLGEAEEKEIQALIAFFKGIESVTAIVFAYPSPSVVKITVSVPDGTTVSHESSNELFVTGLFEFILVRLAPAVENIAAWLN